MSTSTDPGSEARYQDAYQRAKVRSAALVGPSLAERLAALPSSDRARILGSLTVGDLASLLYSWEFFSRPKQRVSDDVVHAVWLIMSGRAFGKNRSAAERIRQRIYDGDRKICLVAPTLNECRRFMVTALLDVFPPAERAQIDHKEEKGELWFNFVSPPAVAYINSDEVPELRGGGYSVAWLDEVGKYRHLETLWSNLEFSMRVQGARPEIIVTTTPRPLRFLKELIADPGTVTIVGTSDENAANLAADFLPRLKARYGDSRIAQQERKGELLEANEGAMFWSHIMDATRVPTAPPLVRIVIPIDPAISTKPNNDPTGIVAMGIDARGHLYILADATGRLAPEAWGAKAVALYDRFEADAFVGERNRGGDLVASNIRARLAEAHGSRASVAKIEEVIATRGKEIRAEPVSTLHEMGKLHIVGFLPELEQELCDWCPSAGGPSPNRLDAVVWGAYSLAKLGTGELNKVDTFSGIGEMNRQLTDLDRAAPTRAVNRHTAALRDQLQYAAILHRGSGNAAGGSGWGGGGGRI